MKTTFFTLLICFLCHYLSAQQGGLGGNDAQTNLNYLGGNDGRFNMVRTFNDSYYGTLGHPFLFDSWCVGEVQLQDNIYYKNVKLKYNIYTDQLIYLRPLGDSVIVSQSKVKGFQLNIPTARKFKNLDNTQYYEVLYEGKTALFTKWKKKILKADAKGAYNAGRRYDEFIEEKELWLQKTTETRVKVKKTKAFFIESFPEKSAELSAYIKENKLNMKEEAAIVRLLQYYDSL
jgi:hypothetical protein